MDGSGGGVTFRQEFAAEGRGATERDKWTGDWVGWREVNDQIDGEQTVMMVLFDEVEASVAKLLCGDEEMAMVSATGKKVSQNFTINYCSGVEWSFSSEVQKPSQAKLGDSATNRCLRC